MDPIAGNHNCRDYQLKPEDVLTSSPKSASVATVLAIRAARVSQKSPLSGHTRRPPTFPFLQLPLELRRQIYTYLLPCTQKHNEPRGILASITSKRLPPTHHNLPPHVFEQLLAKPATTSSCTDNVTWHRGQTALLAVCRQFHDECAELMYGESTFVVFVAYDSITFRFRWSLPNGLTPSRPYEFLDLIPATYLRLIKRLVVTVDHVDSYTGQIKFNVGGKGLTHGLRAQVARLVDAVKTAPNADLKLNTIQRGKRKGVQGVKRLTIKLLNGNDHLDADKRNRVRARESSISGVEEVQTVLEPLLSLRGLVSIKITGAVTDAFVEQLRTEVTKPV